jgi:heme exporter protein B
MRFIITVFRKEMLMEMRNRSGFLTAGLFATITVLTLAIASFGKQLDGTLAGGLIWVALLFAAVVSLPRSFVSEEEQGTGDLLRLLAPAYSVFWGKALFNLAQMVVTGIVLATIYVNVAGVRVLDTPLFLLTLVGGCAALSGTVTLCGALVAQAQNRGVLAGAIALPLLVPFVFLGVASLRLALGDGLGGSSAIIGVWLYAVASYALGPMWFEAIWKA